MSAAVRLALETLTDRVVDLERERDTYRELLVASIDLLREMALERERLCRRVQGLIDELRELRGNARSAA